MPKGFSARRRNTRCLKAFIICAIAVVIISGICFYFLFATQEPLTLATENPPKISETPPEEKNPTPDELTQLYFSGIEEGNYQELYGILTAQSQGLISLEEFAAKHANIYEGIKAVNTQLTIRGLEERENKALVTYDMRMDSIAGEISYSNTMVFAKRAETEEYYMEWSPRMIFPNLNWDDKVQVKTLSAKRGKIFDRNGEMLAGEGAASSVGLVPGRMAGGSLRDERYEDITKIAELLDVSVESIEKKLNASWVRDDVFVPLKNISRDEQELQDALLQIPGVKITAVTVRYYPLAEKASHLIGYIQNVTAEDLENLQDQGYNANSVIGKAGLERIYEDQLRARDGYEIIIADNNGELKETLALKEKTDGADLHLTIDADMQINLYNQFSMDKGCSVAMDPKTGAVLALTSTPAYNANGFILGMSERQWNELNENENMPLYNRFRAASCPGSTMKAITAAIGLNTGIMSPDDDFGPSGLKWQRDGSWGRYFVTTLTEYNGPANIENGLVYSDNIFFGKLALKIGPEIFAAELKRLGFEGAIPFEYGLNSSIISGTGEFTTDIQLADSGYGQGQILMNPIHLSAIYASFVNDGNILKPRLLNSGFLPEIWAENAFSAETASLMKNFLIQVIERGTGKLAHIPGFLLAGKTGTGEIKASKDDEAGTELGWFVMFTADENSEPPLLVAAMAEDVKSLGGSQYLVPKVRELFEYYVFK